MIEVTELEAKLFDRIRKMSIDVISIPGAAITRKLITMESMLMAIFIITITKYHRNRAIATKQNS